MAARKKIPLRKRKLAGKEAVQEAMSLEKILFPSPSKRQNDRTHFGKNTDLDRIDRAIRNAVSGNMVELTDLGYETLALDGHLTGIVQKRLNRAAAIGWGLTANEGAGIVGFDHGRAKDIADFVRSQILRIPFFREKLLDISWGTWNNRSLSEIAWEVGTGASVGDSKLPMGWRAVDLYWVHPRRLSFNQRREVVVLDDVEPGSNFEPKGFEVARVPEKFIVNTPRLFGDYPEREGLALRCLYWSFFQRLGTRERLQLMEIFAAPWRVAWSDGDTPVNTDSIREAYNTLLEMNSRSAAWLAPGVKAQFVQPGDGSGQVHKDVIEDARAVLSKLILGSTGTTDAVSTGLGSSIGDAHLSEEDLIIAGDLYQRADVIEHRLIDVIVELNYGPEALVYSPKFQFDIKGVVDRGKEAENIKKALDIGMQIPLEVAYDRLGYRAPREKEPYLASVLPASQEGLPAAAPRIRIVYPSGAVIPPPGELGIEPEENLDVQEGDHTSSPQQPPDPAQPQKPAQPPAQPAPVQSGDQEPTDASELKVAHPFPSPSGLSDADRE